MNKIVKILSAVISSALLICTAAPAVSADWQTSDDGTVYYINNDTGSLAAGFTEIDGNTYYFGREGNMRTGWLKISGRVYYFNSDGTMRTGRLDLANGRSYWFGDDGVMITGWHRSDTDIYYLSDNGLMIKNTSKVINGILYRFTEKGSAAPVIYSSKMLKKKPSAFSDPEFGMPLKDVALKCGMGYIEKIDERTFAGRVDYSGIDAELITAFNDFGELYYWQLGVEVPYSSFEKTLENIKALDENVNVRDGVYYWVVRDPDGELHSNLFLKYDEELGILFYGWSSYIYSD